VRGRRMQRAVWNESGARTLRGNLAVAEITPEPAKRLCAMWRPQAHESYGQLRPCTSRSVVPGFEDMESVGSAAMRRAHRCHHRKPQPESHILHSLPSQSANTKDHVASSGQRPALSRKRVRAAGSSGLLARGDRTSSKQHFVTHFRLEHPRCHVGELGSP
jgi:hypothetical protein